MTVGSRIAQKRKENNWSQEALGEQLGVSRQSIYKWESDATLPEIEKLLALSKLFGVSVDWLLGVTVQDASQEQDIPPQEELTDAQLQMVEEIVSRYLAAQPKVKARRRWPWLLAAVVVLIIGGGLFKRLEQLGNEYRNLQGALNSLEYSVDHQISGITGRVEEILKSQNHLTAEYGTQLLDMDGENVAFSMRAVPKTFNDGMDAVFLVDNGRGVQEIAAQRLNGGAFSAEATVELTDKITLSVVFVESDGTRQTQLLETYYDLYTGSLIDLMVDSFDLYGTEVADGRLVTYREYYAITKNHHVAKKVGNRMVEVASEGLQVGLFRNQKLVAWAEPCDQPSGYHGFTDSQFYRLPVEKLTDLTGEDVIVVGALVTDTLGRQYMCCDVPYEVLFTEEGKGELTYSSNGMCDRDPDTWTLTAGPDYNTATP